MQRVISFACHGNRGLGLEYLCPRLHMRDHLHVDTRRVHVLKADLAEVIKLPPTTPAAEVLDRYRELAAGKDVVTYVYVTDAAGALKGVVDIREMLAAEPGQTLGDIMTEHVIALPKDATLREAAMMFERYNFRALPITDENDQLLSAVSSRDVRSLKPRLA